MRVLIYAMDAVALESPQDQAHGAQAVWQKTPQPNEMDYLHGLMMSADGMQGRRFELLST